MKYIDKTKEQLINEPEGPRQRIEDLEARETKYKLAELVSKVYLADHKRSIFTWDND